MPEFGLPLMPECERTRQFSGMITMITTSVPVCSFCERDQLRAELVDLRARYAAAVPAAARVSALVRGARAVLKSDAKEYGTGNPEAAEIVRVWFDVADAFDAAHAPELEPDGCVSPKALSGAQDGGGPA